MNDRMTDPVGRIIAARSPALAVNVGAGHGTSLSWLTDSAPATALLIAVDVSVPPGGPPDRVRYVRADAARLPLGDRSVASVTARAALHHVADPAAAARELARVVAAGGTLVVRDATAMPPARAEELRAYLTAGGRPPEPHAGIDPDEVAQAVADAGLAIESLDRAAGTATLAGPRFATPAFQLVAVRVDGDHRGTCGGATGRSSW